MVIIITRKDGIYAIIYRSRKELGAKDYNALWWFGNQLNTFWQTHYVVRANTSIIYRAGDCTTVVTLFVCVFVYVVLSCECVCVTADRRTPRHDRTIIHGKCGVRRGHTVVIWFSPNISLSTTTDLYIYNRKRNNILTNILYCRYIKLI